MYKRILASLFAALLIVALAPLGASAQDERPERLVLGANPSREADVIIDSLEPLADLLSERLEIEVEAFVSTSYTALVEALGTARVDIGFFPPAALVQAMDRYDAQVILASVRHGETSYKAQFNVRCDSGIESFEQLDGRSIAFVDPASASGYQFPFAFLSGEYGIDANTDMDGIFAGSHDAAVLAVYNGDVDVAVSFDDARTTIEGDFPDVMEEVCVLGYTNPIPNDGVVVRAGLAPELVEEIKQALMEIGDTEEGTALLDEMINVTSLAPISPDVYDIVRETSRIFQE